MTVKKNIETISKKDKSFFRKSFTPMEVSFCSFVKSRLDDLDLETADNAFSKYGQFICPELGVESCISVARSRYEYIIGKKTEAEWFSDLKNAVYEIEGSEISISRKLISIDFLINKNEKTNDEKLELGGLLYDLLAEEKLVTNNINIVSNNSGKVALSFLYVLREIEGEGSLLNPIDFRDDMSTFFRGFGGKEVSFCELKEAVFSESKKLFKLISAGGVIESQFSLAEKGRCDTDSLITKAEVLKSYSERCLFLSSVAVSLGSNDSEIKDMYIYHNNIKNRIKKAFERAGSNMSADIGI